ncbi:MAG: low affinity iron permease family protein [Rhizomicrobium sp.]
MSEEAQPAPNFLSRRFALIAGGVARVTGHPLTFILSCALIATWVIASTVFHLADAWQTLISTAITIVTFLMVFLIQSTQNRDGAAVQAKLDELIRALEPAKNKFIGIENKTIEEVHELRQETVEEVKLLEELVVEVKGERDDLERAQTLLTTPTP